MLEAIEKHKASSQWQKDGGQFIPHPATWLNQERWEDEINDNAKIVPIRKNDAQAGFMGAAKLLGISEEEIWQQQGS